MRWSPVLEEVKKMLTSIFITNLSWAIAFYELCKLIIPMWDTLPLHVHHISFFKFDHIYSFDSRLFPSHSDSKGTGLMASNEFCPDQVYPKVQCHNVPFQLYILVIAYMHWILSNAKKTILRICLDTLILSWSYIASIFMKNLQHKCLLRYSPLKLFGKFTHLWS